MTIASRSTFGWLKFALLSGVVLAPGIAMAQQADGGEIIVTAQKREQNIQKVSIAITAIGQAGLAQLGRQDVSALASQVPSLQVQQYAPTVTVFNIRGVSQNDAADSQEAPIAFYSDGVYVSALGAISGQTFDLQRVEVLRGPQGTLFGRNATGGLVQAISAPPTDALEGFITVTAASYGQYSTEGAISGPLSDRLQARLSFTTNNGGDYIKNRTGPDLGGAKFYAGRFQLASQIGDTGKFKLKLTGLRNAHDRQAGLYSFAASAPNAQGLGQFISPGDNPFGTCPGCDALGYKEPDNNPYTVSFDGPNYFDRTYYDATGTYSQEIGDLNLVSISDYQHLKKSYADDEDMSPTQGFNYQSRQNLDQASQELRLSQTTDRINWVLGIYGIVINTRNSYDANVFGSLGLDSRFATVLNTKSIAGFGQVEYKLDDKFSIIGGFRYSEDWKKFSYTHSYNGINDFYFDKSTNPDLADRKFGNFSGKINIDYKPDDNTLIYLSINRGTKSGGFNTPAFTPVDPNLIPFKQEVLTNYEGGLKLTLFDKTSHLNLSGFHYTYNNYQSFELSSLSVLVRNKQANVNGAEIEFNTRPITGLYLQVFATFLDTNVKNVTIPSGLVLDRKMPNAPTVSIGASVQYDFPIGPGNMTVQTSWKYDSHQYFSTFNEPVNREPSRIVGDVRVSYIPTGSPIEAALFVNNVTDKQYRIYASDYSSPFGYTNQAYARPRWFGGSLTYRIR